MQAACGGGLDCRMGAGHGEERTENMLYMSVTSQVSKLSGWLNADAYCRESNGGHTVCGASYGTGGGRWRAMLQAVCRGGPEWRLGAGHEEVFRSAPGT